MTKGKIINIEYSPDNSYNHSYEEFMECKLVWLLDEIKQAASEGYTKIVAVMLIDGLLLPTAEVMQTESKILKEETDKLGIDEIILVSGHGGTYFPVPLYFDKVLATDYTLRFTYNSYQELLINNRLPKYKPTGRFLFLGGVPSRLNRIGLAYKFFEQGLLNDDCAVWTFFKPWNSNEERESRQILNHISDKEYNKFVNFANRRLDDVYEYSKHFFSSDSVDSFWHDIVNHEWARKPGYLDSSVFDTTSLSIISEGPNYWEHSNNNDFVTEKFWRAVFHRHPFLFAGEIEQYQYMKKLGFRSFEEYLPHPDYGILPLEEDRMNALVANTKFWLENETKIANKVQEDVEYNYNLATKYIQEQINFIKDLQSDYNLSDEDIDYYFNQTGYQNLIVKPPLYDEKDSKLRPAVFPEITN